MLHIARKYKSRFIETKDRFKCEKCKTFHKRYTYYDTNM